MNKTTIAGLTISAVERTHAWWRYVLPFQTRRALLTILAVQAVCLPCMALFAYLAAPHLMFQIVLGSALSGFTIALHPYLPARLTLATRGEARHFACDLQALLAKLRYVESEQLERPGRFHYRSKRSRMLRWDEEDIELLVRDHELVLNGPIYILRHLRAKLLKPGDFAYLDKKA
jgi:hypothetical protein